MSDLAGTGLGVGAVVAPQVAVVVLKPVCGGSADDACLYAADVRLSQHRMHVHAWGIGLPWLPLACFVCHCSRRSN